jgi:hypothetical protein
VGALKVESAVLLVAAAHLAPNFHHGALDHPLLPPDRQGDQGHAHERWAATAARRINFYSASRLHAHSHLSSRAGKLAGQASSGGKNFSTIPSKFETTLFTGNKEKDGFGSRAHRFVDMENDLPGPGTYNDADKRIADDKVYSKKGLGVGFVSKTRRDSFIKAGAQGPGPGNYERGGTFAEDVKNLNRANRSGSTSTFKPPTERSVLVASDPMPGPSDYKLRRELDAHHDVTTGRPLGDSVFRSGTQRKTAGAGDPSMPGPGVYNPVLLSALDDKMTLPTAPFRSQVPIAGVSYPERLTREQQLGIVTHVAKTQNVGPGEYNVPVNTFANAQGYRRMPQFIDSNTDRFGKVISGSAPTIAGTTPGPGAYYSEPERETAVISGSSFMSGTIRGRSGHRDVVPGPAYYSPAPSNNKKSYHLNARQRWMPAT